MSSKNPLYIKADKVRTILLLFVDKEIIAQQKKKIKKDKPIFTKTKSLIENQNQKHYIQMEETFGNIKKTEKVNIHQNSISANQLLKKNYTSNNLNIFNIQVLDINYKIKKFYKRDSTICFENKKSAIKNEVNYKEYLSNLAKKFKKKKSRINKQKSNRIN